MSTGFRRYAVYFAPSRDSALGRFGAEWLGWDAEAGAELSGPDLPGLPRPRAELVAAPSRYGFHATLKAPFRLAEGAHPDLADRAIQAVAAEHAAFRFFAELSSIGPFLALTPVGEVPPIAAIAAACVTRLDGLRAPSTPDEIARRDPDRLVGREAEYLAAWGYPYVFEHFRFHITLTGPLSSAEQAATRAAIEPVLAPILLEPVAFDDLCLFGEAANGRFHLLRRHPLGAAA